MFPLSLGGERILSEPGAYVSLKDQLTFKRLIFDFKYINIFLFPLIFFSIRLFYKKKKDFLKIVNLIFILSTFFYVFNQLVTANQIYIFSLISKKFYKIDLSRYSHSCTITQFVQSGFLDLQT